MSLDIEKPSIFPCPPFFWDAHFFLLLFRLPYSSVSIFCILFLLVSAGPFVFLCDVPSKTMSILVLLTFCVWLSSAVFLLLLFTFRLKRKHDVMVLFWKFWVPFSQCDFLHTHIMQIIIFYYIYLLPFETFFAFTRNNTGLHGIFFSVTTQQHLAPTHTHTLLSTKLINVMILLIMSILSNVKCDHICS